MEEAINAYRQLMEQHPDHPEPPFYLGQISLQAGDLPQAIAHLKKASALKPESPEILNSLAAVLVQSQRLEEAVDALERLVRLVPSASLWNNLGVTQRNLGQFDQAETSFKAAIGIDPSGSKAMSNLGGLMNDLARLDEAEEFLTKALEMDPKSAEAWNNLGMLHISRDQPDQAVTCFDKALTLRPDYTRAKENLARLNLLLAEIA
jgi:Flp pilus assembly protein TadD